ncbi:MAG TPA: hypothetical protein RMH99_29390 [Sandaracinaceae bacterium LLY-WYZ-13_1]|nr:hypothetical protein [Sandaracinaceae bacterium LLY-WYZ-13_1]
MIAKGHLLVLLAVPVCAAVAVSVGVVSVDVLASGEPVGAAEVMQALVFLVGPLLVVGIALYVTRNTAEAGIARRLYGGLLLAGAVAGAGFGGWFGWTIVEEKHAQLDARAAEACGWARAGGEEPPRCVERARACLLEVRAHPPEVARGFSAADAHEASPHVPRNAHDRAVYECLRP